MDDAAKKAVEVVSATSSTLIEKATEADIAELEAYTIRHMDEKLPLGSDIEHYKMLKVQEPALDNRLKHLDVMCFPFLFPSGKFGEFHPREVKLSFSEYIKSRLLNQDSRFRKCPEFVFYYLWQKELRELSSGIYNVLKNTGRHGTSVKDFLKGVDSSNKQTEANLSTMFQSVRRTKQFWFLKKSDLNCMIREHGPPSLFLHLVVRNMIPQILLHTCTRSTMFPMAIQLASCVRKTLSLYPESLAKSFMISSILLY